MQKEVTEQAAAFCIRRDDNGDVQVLMVASLKTGKWGLAKGHIEQGETSYQAAEREALEEAGVVGEVCTQPVGSFLYEKQSSPKLYRATVHVLKVHRVLDAYPERGLRERRWVGLSDIVSFATHPGLKDLVSRLANEIY